MTRLPSRIRTHGDGSVRVMPHVATERYCRWMGQDDEEDLDTWYLGCSVLLMVCIATNEVLKSEKNKKLAIVYKAYASLSGESHAFARARQQA